MDGRIGTEERNLDDPHPQAEEIVEGFRGQERSVGKNVHVATFEPGLKHQVMDIGEQQRFAAGEGKMLYRGL